ncbi:hypothetical protein FGO68_gene2410 [Halteria grandinella]|uniref:Uncharacterized protein n=1 Tax=Halteria grandinella TaxID=5974 RepID=A0A8J8NBU2_HALGN|nr:hypothetical protein FGO68_gene2410 [Halteria grandinella]
MVSLTRLYTNSWNTTAQKPPRRGNPRQMQNLTKASALPWRNCWKMVPRPTAGFRGVMSESGPHTIIIAASGIVAQLGLLLCLCQVKESDKEGADCLSEHSLGDILGIIHTKSIFLECQDSSNNTTQEAAAYLEDDVCQSKWLGEAPISLFAEHKRKCDGRVEVCARGLCCKYQQHEDAQQHAAPVSVAAEIEERKEGSANEFEEKDQERACDGGLKVALLMLHQSIIQFII